jgi:UDP-glucose 4,6-dehydratase
VDACEVAREETLAANTLLPQTVARVCLMNNTPWGHVSSGCIYAGAKVIENGRMRLEKNLNQPEIRRLLAEHPDRVIGFNELDQPNFSFRNRPCSFYSGSKALAEETIQETGPGYIWRPGMPFSERAESRNFLSRIQNHPKVYNGVHPLSHVEDFVRACMDLWERQAPFGIYNMANAGAVTTVQVVEMIQRILKPDRQFEFWKDDEEFYRCAARAPRANCVLDISRLLATGVTMRSVEEALEGSLRNWQSATTSPELALH